MKTDGVDHVVSEAAAGTAGAARVGQAAMSPEFADSQ